MWCDQELQVHFNHWGSNLCSCLDRPIINSQFDFFCHNIIRYNECFSYWFPEYNINAINFYPNKFLHFNIQLGWLTHCHHVSVVNSIYVVRVDSYLGQNLQTVYQSAIMILKIHTRLTVQFGCTSVFCWKWSCQWCVIYMHQDLCNQNVLDLLSDSDTYYQ